MRASCKVEPMAYRWHWHLALERVAFHDLAVWVSRYHFLCGAINVDRGLRLMSAISCSLIFVHRFPFSL